ncbi:MAG: hypothetical protein ACRC1T_09475 [Clostridium chrysemydis]|uniref:hypothetical protein n=1 Tax=Clostridium chrysemydis TaxID=2665504 RepID=UPI003F2B2EB6
MDNLLKEILKDIAVHFSITEATLGIIFQFSIGLITGAFFYKISKSMLTCIFIAFVLIEFTKILINLSTV